MAAIYATISRCSVVLLSLIGQESDALILFLLSQSRLAHFNKILKEFLVSAEAEVRSLASLYSGVGRNADALVLYFGEDPARCPFEQVVSTLLNFVRMFVRAHEENCKQLEFQKKQAQKEAESEKMKMGASKMESEHLNELEKKKANEKKKIGTPRKESDHFIQTPIKSANTT